MALEKFCLFSELPLQVKYLYVVGLVLTELVQRLVVTFHLKRREN